MFIQFTSYIVGQILVMVKLIYNKFLLTIKATLYVDLIMEILIIM